MDKLPLMIIAVAIVILVIFLVIFLMKAIKLLTHLNQVADEATHSVNVLTKDLDLLVHQTTGLISKVDFLVGDVDQKLNSIDPLFTAVADLSETISDLNTTGHKVVDKAYDQIKKTGRIITISLLFKKILKLLKKKEAKIKNTVDLRS